MIMAPDVTIKGKIIKLEQVRSNIALAQKLYETILLNAKHLSYWLEYENNYPIKNLEDSFRYLIYLEDCWQKQEQYSYFIYTLNNELVGFISATLTEPENCGLSLHFWIVKEKRQRGYISEAITLIEKNFFFLGIERIVICCDVKCKIIENLALKNGYLFEGIKRHGYWNPIKSKFMDVCVFSKIAK